jgi:hypothetical protein
MRHACQLPCNAAVIAWFACTDLDLSIFGGNIEILRIFGKSLFMAADLERE